MNKSNKFINFAFYIIIIILILYILISLISTQKLNKTIGYQFYTVLTDSMEPKIPTYSLVCIKNFKDDESIKLNPQQIITFSANRFGQSIILTHHFNKTERDDSGKTLYRTNAEGTDFLDSYKTTRENLIGTYVFHIPYIGKIFLFLKSKLGFILYGELLVIFLIDSLIRSYLEEKDIK